MQSSSSYEKALAEFAARLPALVQTIMAHIGRAHLYSDEFNAAFRAGLDGLEGHLLQEYAQPDPFSVFPPHIRELKPDLDQGQLDALLAQHLLLERLFRCVFPDALRQNFFARQLDAVLQSLCAVGLSRADFLASLDGFYLDLEGEFRACTSGAQTQHALNAVCEQFLNSFDPQQAVQWGVKYTPQEIVDFMCASTEAQLQQAFGRTLSSPMSPSWIRVQARAPSS